MPPILAAVIYLSLIAYLFWREAKLKSNVTPALWLPTIWVFISGTRFVTQWLNTFGINIGGTSYEEGSPIDAAFFGIMTLLAVRVLIQRRVTLEKFARYNPWVVFYLVFCLIACVWSDFTFVAFKRWTKLFGQVVMVTVVLTEADPREAVLRMFKRIAYVVVPVSILFIKYFPQWGRGFDRWTGFGYDNGATLDKNALGYDCMLILIVLGWNLMSVWQKPKGRERRNEIIFECAFMAATIWLLLDAHSSTSLVCTMLALIIAYILGFKWVKPEKFTLYLVGTVVVIFVAEYGFNFTTFFITQVLGKDMTLTDRTKIWDILLHWDFNFLIGTGYESFWLGERREKLWDLFPELHLNSAHNGYLQTYLDMGALGLVATFGLVVSAYSKAKNGLLSDFRFARLRLGLLLSFLVYNWTEVAFRTHCVPFFGFFLAAINFPWSAESEVNRSLVRNNIPPDKDGYEF